MKKITIALMSATLILLIGCGGTSGTHSYVQAEAPKPTKQTIVYSNGGDVTINDATVDNGGQYITNDDGTITYISGDGNGINDNSGYYNPDENMSGFFDPMYTQQECNANGYFWCPLESKCLNKPTNGSSCTSNQAITIKVNML